MLKLLIPFSIFVFGSIAFPQDQQINPLSAQLYLKPERVIQETEFEIQIYFKLDPGFKAYEDQFKVEVLNPYPIEMGELDISPVKTYFDKFSKRERRIVQDRGAIKAKLKLPPHVEIGEQKINLELKYQACTDTFCLFPKKIQVEAQFEVIANGQETAARSEGRGLLEETFEGAKKRGLLFLIFFVFLAGVLTSLTPCLLPMVPITIAVLHRGHAHTKRARLINSIYYILGIAFTYSALGVVAASSGALFGSVLNHPAVQIFFALVFIILGLGQFGLFEMQTPLALQNRLIHFNRLPGRLGIFLSGLVSGLIASPCVGPVLVGILTFVAQTQDVVQGFVLLFVYALGLGQLLVVLGVSTTLLEKFPRSPAVMKASKILLGVTLIAGGLFYLSLVWPQNFSINKGPVDEQPINHLDWRRFTDEDLNAAIKSGKPVIIDFYADWCLACKELDLKTFSNQKVHDLSRDFTLFKFDATEESPLLSELKKRYGIVGLPTIIFYDRSGVWRKDLTLNEFEDAEKFVQRMKKSL